MSRKMSRWARVKILPAVTSPIKLRRPRLNKLQLWEQFYGKPLGSCGWTIVELLISMAIVSTLAGIAMPVLGTYVEHARSAKAVSDIRTTLEAGINLYQIDNDSLPLSLNDINRGGILDPWGNTYKFLNFSAAGPSWQDLARKTSFVVPLNSTFDLYSMGKDGKSVASLMSRSGQDDIIRANDGGYVGLASEY